MAARGVKRGPQSLLYGGVKDTYEDRDSDLLCPICLDMMSEPYVTTCGHSFCHGCIIRSLELASKCPKCGGPLDNSGRNPSVFPNVTLNALIAKEKKRVAGSQDGNLVLKDFTTLLDKREWHPSELVRMQEVLLRKQCDVDAERKLTEAKLLGEFLEQLKAKKNNELRNVQQELEVLDKDLQTAQTLYPGKELAKEKEENNEEKMQFNETAFNSTLTPTPLSIAQRRVRMHQHFEDLEEKYWALRNNSFGGDGEERESLLDFQSNLNQLTRWSKLRPLANLSYGSELLNTAHIVSSIEFDRDADFFAIAGVTKRIKVYDYAVVVRDAVDLHYPVMEMVAGSKISCISWSAYHKSVLCSSDYEGSVSVWDASVGTRLRVFQEHEKRCWSVDFNRMDSHLMASGSDDSRVKIWSLNAEHSVATLEAKANVCCVKFNPYSRYCLAYGAADHCVHYVDLRQPKEPLRVFKGHRKAVSYVKFLSDRELVSASTDSQLKLWSVDDNVSYRSFRGHTNEKNFVGLSTTDGSKDDRRDLIACGSENNALYLYSKGLSQPLLHYRFDVVKSALLVDKERAEQEESAEFVSAVCWKPDSNVIVAANSQGTIKILELV
ncbi:E3 ubiquitin-protein ligase COP1-like [Daphnia carinata]|uniref:E3 ubiquitin-protein ligase COP1-like n=1 Tax=Daphnia carinata TaxID=120202 RepID=UPI00257A7C27|nr:E3 ubiquitin-protein ligase COP1-like [Daphnia carinata]